MKISRKTGKVVAILAMTEDSDVLMISQNGKIIRIESNQIRQVGRSAQGVTLVRMEDGDQVAAASLVPETNGNGNGAQSDEEEPQGSLPLQ